LLTGDVIHNTESFSWAGVTGVSGTIVARWTSGATFACAYQFGLGRLYFQAAWDSLYVSGSTSNTAILLPLIPLISIGIVAAIVIIVVLVYLVTKQGRTRSPPYYGPQNTMQPYQQQTWRCPNCSAPNLIEYIYCFNCGAKKK
jgi:hypothetical protein